MNKLLISTGALAALALSSAPAYASVTATSQATAQAKIFRPLTLDSVDGLDLGTIVLAGVAPYSATVSVQQDGTFDCDANSGNVVCSGATKAAQYVATGTTDAVITVSAPDVTLTGSNGGSLTLTTDAPATVDLGATANAGTDFNIGGSIAVSDTTTDGLYTGTFAVTADYQ